MSRHALRLVASEDQRHDAHGDRPRFDALLERPVEFAAHRVDEFAIESAAESLVDHLARLGHRPSAPGATLIEILDAVELTGRGGGHFPAAAKWRAVLAAGSGYTVIANAAEGEPASAKDAALVQHRPHLVLDGLVCAAEAVGAADVLVWLHGDARASRVAVDHALAERQAARLREPPIRVVTAPAHYLAGESSAVVRALSGGPALPSFQRVPAAARGVHGRPTLLHNVETLARIGLAARTGASGYRPTTLLTVVAGGSRTVVEVDPATTLAGAVEAAGAAARPEPQAVLVGGYGGSWLPWVHAAGLPAHEPALRAAGASLGAGVVAPLPTGLCGLAETARIVGYLAASSARQCGPCLFGLPAIADLVHALAAGVARRSDLRRLRRYLGEVDGRGACHHPDGAVRLVSSALRTFGADVVAHVRGRACDAAARTAVLPIPAVG